VFEQQSEQLGGRATTKPARLYRPSIRRTVSIGYLTNPREELRESLTSKRVGKSGARRARSSERGRFMGNFLSHLRTHWDHEPLSRPSSAPLSQGFWIAIFDKGSDQVGDKGLEENPVHEKGKVGTPSTASTDVSPIRNQGGRGGTRPYPSGGGSWEATLGACGPCVRTVTLTVRVATSSRKRDFGICLST